MYDRLRGNASIFLKPHGMPSYRLHCVPCGCGYPESCDAASIVLCAMMRSGYASSGIAGGANAAHLAASNFVQHQTTAMVKFLACTSVQTQPDPDPDPDLSRNPT